MSASEREPRAEGGRPRGKQVLRVCALYPDLMNIYADRGNLLMLRKRCQWRGIDFELAEVSIGQALHPDAHDLIYLGGGQDRDQLLCAEDLLADKGQAMSQAAAAGVMILGVCGGYQLLGRSYELDRSQRIAGLGLLDVLTVREPGPRLIGNVAIEVDLGGGPRVLAGFENHGGRTRLLDGQAPLGRVLKGHGNDGESGFEGARSGSVIGTYLHGPLLPKNAWFADWLIASALGIGIDDLLPLEDDLERRAHLLARSAAGL
jgi:lipid II isoglutaminyl synthase (glutamine-hydrolysing)